MQSACEVMNKLGVLIMLRQEFKQILAIIDRSDIAEEIQNEFSLTEQDQMLDLLRDLMTDEITFVLALQKKNQESKRKQLQLIDGGRL